MINDINQNIQNLQNNTIPIYCGKLTSGEIIIGRLQNTSLINCLKINVNYDITNSSFNINFIPLLYPISNSLETVPLNNIILLKQAEQNIIELYVKYLLVYVNQELTKNTSQLNEKIDDLKNKQNSEQLLNDESSEE